MATPVHGTSFAEMAEHIRRTQYWKELDSGQKPYIPAPDSGFGGYYNGSTLPVKSDIELQHEVRIRELEIQLAERDEIIEALVADLEALQEKTPEPDKEGWIKWMAPERHLGDMATPCPIRKDAMIEVMLRCYGGVPTRNTSRAEYYDWHECGGGTILSYRFI